MNSMVMLMFAVVIVIGITLLVIISLTRRPSRILDQEKYREKWLTISQGVTNDTGTQQLAVLHADKLLDQALRESGVPGETLGERLKNAKARFRNVNAVWSAHKLRNQIAHDDHVRISRKQTDTALAAFKAALIDLGAL
jgi:hypothetical protein